MVGWREDTWEAAQEWVAKRHFQAESRHLRRIVLRMEDEYFHTRGHRCHGFLWNLIPYIPKGDYEALERAREYAARLYGWLETAARTPIPGGRCLLGLDCLQPVLEHSPDQMGAGLPHIAVGTSPRRIARHIWRAYRRAEEILRPYRWGVRRYAVEAAVRWILVVARLGRRPPRVGKLAVIMAASSLPWGLWLIRSGGTPGVPWFEAPYFYGSFKEARRVLARGRGFGSRVTHDPDVFPLALKLVKAGEVTWAEAQEHIIALLYEGQEDDQGWLVSPHPWYTYHGVGVHIALTPWGHLSLVVRAAGCPDYHWDEALQEKGGLDPIKDALAAWRRQRRAEAKAKARRQAITRLLAKSYLGDTSAQVSVQDSLDAGNCRPGTLNWCRKHGISTDAVPAYKLARYASDPAVRRVLAVAAQRVAA